MRTYRLGVDSSLLKLPEQTEYTGVVLVAGTPKRGDRVLFCGRLLGTVIAPISWLKGMAFIRGRRPLRKALAA